MTALDDDGSYCIFRAFLKTMPSTSRRTLRGLALPHEIIRISKVKIRMNIDILGVSTKEGIWGTVVHEMLRAYSALTSGWRVALMNHHGSPFEQYCKAAVRYLNLEGLEVRHVV